MTDEALVQARDAHVFAYAEWVARQPFLTFASPPGAELYAPITADDTLSNCCGHLLSAIELEIMYPADAERLRQARSGRRRPAPTEVGLTPASTSEHLNQPRI